MRRILLCFLFVVAALSAWAQTRNVRGYVTDESGGPLGGVTIKAQTGEQFTTAADGKFQFPVTFHCRSLTFSLRNYLPVTIEIDGSYLMVSMKYDNTAALAAQRAEEARRAAEEEARLAAEKAAAAALLAREKAVRDSLHMEAQKQKARMEEEKRKKEAEEKARLAAEEKAKKEAEAKARAEKKRLVAEENSRKDKAYDEQFVNHGLEHSVDISYAYSLSRGYVRYVYSGYRDVGSTHPVEVDYSLSYRFSRLISVGGGVGLLYHLKSVSIQNDDYIPAYEKFREKQLDIPVFARLKLNFLRTKVRPMVNVQAGCYCLSGVFYGEAGVGVEYRMGKKLALQLSASLRTVPWPRFNEQKGASYVMSLAPGVKLGVSF